MNESMVDYRSLVIVCTVIAFVFMFRRSERVRSERRRRVTDALAVLAEELMPA